MAEPDQPAFHLTLDVAVAWGEAKQLGAPLEGLVVDQIIDEAAQARIVAAIQVPGLASVAQLPIAALSDSLAPRGISAARLDLVNQWSDWYVDATVSRRMPDGSPRTRT
jgi:hypothetical protein